MSGLGGGIARTDQLTTAAMDRADGADERRAAVLGGLTHVELVDSVMGAAAGFARLEVTDPGAHGTMRVVAATLAMLHVELLARLGVTPPDQDGPHG